MKLAKLFILCIAAAAIWVDGANATIIGNWSGSFDNGFSRSWNSSSFSQIKNLMISNGHTVLANDTLANSIAAADVLIVGETETGMTAAEIVALADWIADGHVLMLFSDSGYAEFALQNTILAGIGSSISLSSTLASPANPTLSGGIFAVDGPPFNIAGQTLATTDGLRVSGGTAMAGEFIRYQKIGDGYVFVFGDRSDHNFFAPSAGNTNGKLFLNIVAGAVNVPEPTTVGLLILSVGVVGLTLRRHKR